MSLPPKFLFNSFNFRANRKMSQSELSSVGSDSPASGNDEKGSLIGDRGRSLQRNRALGRTSSSGKGSKYGKRDDAGDYPTVRMPLLSN